MYAAPTLQQANSRTQNRKRDIQLASGFDFIFGFLKESSYFSLCVCALKEGSTQKKLKSMV